MKKLFLGLIFTIASFSSFAATLDLDKYTTTQSLLNALDNTLQSDDTLPQYKLSLKIYRAALYFISDYDLYSIVANTEEEAIALDQKVLSTIKSWINPISTHQLPSFIRQKEAEQTGLLVNAFKQRQKEKLIRNAARQDLGLPPLDEDASAPSSIDFKDLK